jgi:hypothetical protein
MARRNPELEIGAHMALAALVAVACITGIPPLIDTAARAIAQSKADVPHVGLACRACGIVESVREVTLDATKYGVSTVSGEGSAMILSLLSGKLGAGPVKIHEVAVRLQDGSLRVFREGVPSAWKSGDRVKVSMGRIKPLS